MHCAFSGDSGGMIEENTVCSSKAMVHIDSKQIPKVDVAFRMLEMDIELSSGVLIPLQRAPCLQHLKILRC